MWETRLPGVWSAPGKENPSASYGWPGIGPHTGREWHGGKCWGCPAAAPWVGSWSSANRAAAAGSGPGSCRAWRSAAPSASGCSSAPSEASERQPGSPGGGCVAAGGWAGSAKTPHAGFDYGCCWSGGPSLTSAEGAYSCDSGGGSGYGQTRGAGSGSDCPCYL